MVCLFWLIFLAAIQDKSPSQKHLTAMLGIATVYFYIDAFYLLPGGTHAGFIATVFPDIVSQFITTALPASAILYIKSLRGENASSREIMLLYIPGIFLGTAAVVIYSFMGMNGAADYISAMNTAGGRPPGFDAPIYKLHEAICRRAYNIAVFTEVIIAFAISANAILKRKKRGSGLRAFLCDKGKMYPPGCQCVLLIVLLLTCVIRIGMGRIFLVNRPGLSGMISVFLGSIAFCLSYIGVLFPDREFDIRDLRHPTVLRKPEADVHNIESLRSRIGSSPSPRKEEVKYKPTLLETFIEYMGTQKPYLNPNLSITDVALALNSNRTYVSVLINENFGITFRDYINEERINYAKQIMLKNPDEILEVIAEKSGFSGDSQFAKKFKELENISPKAWLMQQLKKQ